MRRDRLRCPGCSTFMHEWERDPFAYVGYSWRCPGCELLRMEEEMIPTGTKGAHVGLRLHPNRIAAAEAAIKAAPRLPDNVLPDLPALLDAAGGRTD